MKLIQRLSADIDWVGEWFHVLAENGEDINMPIAYQPHPSATPQWFAIPHTKQDGVQGLNTVLKKMGYPAFKRPAKQTVPPPRLRQILKGIRNYKRYSVVNHVNWKNIDRNKTGASAGVAHIKLSKDETQISQKAAHYNKASLAAFLLWGLNESAKQLHWDKNKPQQWLSPVHLRPRLNTSLETPNQTSFIGVTVSSGDSPYAIHRQIRKSMKDQQHWGSWYGLRLAGKLYGKKVFQKAYSKYCRLEHSWTGTFSYLGEWPYDHTSKDLMRKDDCVFGAAVTTRFLPIGAAALIWKKQLVLGLQLHPSLSQQISDAEALIQEWRRCLLSAHPSQSGNNQGQ